MSEQTEARPWNLPGYRIGRLIGQCGFATAGKDGTARIWDLG